MYRLEKDNYFKVVPLIKEQNELSVHSVIDGVMPGEVFVNNIQEPSAVFIRTSECNYIAGSVEDEKFNRSIEEELDFWDPVTPDTKQWKLKIPTIHRNKFIRRYVRRHYTKVACLIPIAIPQLPNDYILETVSPSVLREQKYENSDKLLSWIENWGNDETFCNYGVGSYIRKGTTIVSWCLSDCYYKDKIAIGIHTDDRFRNKGLGINAAAAVIKQCFEHGYKQIDWLCVDKNNGSIALAEKLGFKLMNQYDAFSSYPPIENLKDLTEEEWHEWADYLENAAYTETNLWVECLYAYIKANEPAKAQNAITMISQHNTGFNHDLDGFISYLHNIGMASRFRNDWYKSLNYLMD